jgi:flagellar motor switch protein FliG
MCNDDEGEHVVLILRIPNGQYIKTATFGDDKEEADKFFDKYSKKNAEEFVKEFEKVIVNE